MLFAWFLFSLPKQSHSISLPYNVPIPQWRHLFPDTPLGFSKVCNPGTDWFWDPNPAVPTNSQLFVGEQHGLEAQDYKLHCSPQPQVLKDKSLFTTDEVEIKARLKHPPVISWVLCGCASERLLSPLQWHTLGRRWFTSSAFQSGSFQNQRQQK